jgi:hypothetical protein
MVCVRSLLGTPVRFNVGRNDNCQIHLLGVPLLAQRPDTHPTYKVGHWLLGWYWWQKWPAMPHSLK